MIMPKSVRAFNHIVHNVPFPGADGIISKRGWPVRAVGPAQDKVFRNKYNPRASGQTRAIILFYYKSSRSLVSARVLERPRKDARSGWRVSTGWPQLP